MRFLRFLVVGGSSALLQFGVLAALKGQFGDRCAYVVSWVISTALHYTLNRFWALPSTRHDAGKQLGEYLAVAGVSLVINFAFFSLWRDIVGLGVYWSTFWAIPPSTLVIFLLLNYRVFRRNGTTRRSV